MGVENLAYFPLGAIKGDVWTQYKHDFRNNIQEELWCQII